MVRSSGRGRVVGSSRGLDEGRSSAYASAIARITESPVVGTGPGTYGVERMRDPVDVLGHLAFPDAHNIVLNNLAESGIVGLIGLLGTVVLLGLAVRGSWRRSPDERLVIGGALFGLAIFAAHGMVDVVFALVGTIVVAVALAAIAATSGNPAEPSGRPARRTLPSAAWRRRGRRRPRHASRPSARSGFSGPSLDADAALTRQPAHALELARAGDGLGARPGLRRGGSGWPPPTRRATRRPRSRPPGR